MIRHLRTCALVLLLAGCGSGGHRAVPTARPTPTPAVSDRPPVVLGAKNFTEEYVLGQLYRQALVAAGFRVRLVNNIGRSELVDRELEAGLIAGYPEYTGTILSALAHDPRRPASAAQTYAWAQEFEQGRGLTLLDMTPAQDSDVLVAKTSYALAHHLGSLADLRRLGPDVRLGAAPEFATRFSGLVGLRQRYGVNRLRFEPLPIGDLYPALDHGRVELAAVFRTDGQLRYGDYAELADPENIFGFQNVTFVVRKSVLAAEGPEFARTINAVSAKLSTQALRELNAAVALGQQSPTDVARQFLQANGLA